MKTRERTLALGPPKVSNRILMLLFVISVALPIVWGQSAEIAHAQDIVPGLRPAPETTEELLALAAVAPARRPRAPRIAPKQRLSQTIDGGETEVRTRETSYTAPTLAEYYARTPNSLRAQGLSGAARSEVLLAAAGEEPATADVGSGRLGSPSSAALSGFSSLEERPGALSLPTRPVVLPEEPVLLAQAGAESGRVSAAALLRSSAVAPQLAAVGASTSRSARDATTQSESDIRRNVRSERRGPVPATRREIEEARRARAAVISGASASTAPRRRVAMHRVAAAAASSLNEATPFRTAVAGDSRFAGSGVQAAESLGYGLDRAAEAVSAVPGMRLENVTLTAGYSSNGLPGARSLYGANSQVGSDTDFRGSATLAYRKNFRTSSLGLIYTPSRVQRNRFSQWNTTDHVLGLQLDRQLGRRWGVALNASAANTGIEQFWYRSPSFRRVENPPTSFDELLQRVDAGEFTDEEFASILTGAPIVEDPGGRELDLSRVTSLNSSLSASYARSARNTISFGVGTSQYDSSFRTGSRDSSDRPQINNISRHNAFVRSTHRLNASTNAGISAVTNVNSSSFGDSTAQSATFFADRRLSRFWTARVEGGVGFVTLASDSPLAQLRNLGDGAQATWVAGGGLGYRYGGHTFSSSLRRSVGDSMGLSSTSTLSAGIDWQWTNPRMPWVFSGSASYSKSDWGFVVFDDSGTAFQSTFYQGAVTRKLSPSTAFTTGYYFGRYESPLRGLLTGSSVHRVQASFLWRPAEAR